jgi:chemotaxis protein methyltransferase CheR
MDHDVGDVAQSAACAGIPDEWHLTAVDFAAITALVHDIAGIALGPSKRELVVGRLNRRLRVLGLQSFAEYRALLDDPAGAAERVELINALTTNLTSFFREPHHFSCLADTVLPELLAPAANGRLRIWSAACSSGEEPYSIAMVLAKKLAARRGWDARILATDIDTNMLRTAQDGCYDAERASTIPAEFARSLSRRRDGKIVMPDVLKQRITFNPLNLLDPWPMRGKFDVVFCRNVIIYFNKDTQRGLFTRLADIMAPRGWLFIGHSESLHRVSDRFEPLGRTIYRRN